MEEVLFLENDYFQVGIDRADGGVKVLKRPLDSFDTNYVKTDDRYFFGDVQLQYRFGNDDSQKWTCSDTHETGKVVNRRDKEIAIRCDPMACGSIQLTQSYRLGGDQGEALIWTIELHNRLPETPVEFGDVALPLLFNQRYVTDTMVTYTQRLIRHSFISGNGSFLYWCRPNGVGPFLVMTPEEGSRLEYYSRDYEQERGGWEGPYTVYIHSAATGVATGGSWNQPHTSRVIGPGETYSCSFRLNWADSHEEVRDVLYGNGLIDVYAAPGMTVPQDLSVQVALRTKKPVHLLEFDHPSDTRMEYLGVTGADTHLYKLAFSRTGEQVVTVHYGNREKMILEFFSTKPVEDLLKTRTSFIVNRQQYRGEQWYDGLFSLWDMETMQMTHPGHTLGLNEYCVGGSDDPTLPKAPLIAEKNIHYPDAQEIEAIEYYMEHFLWGGLQRRTDEQPYPHGIYGSDNWFQNRNSPIGYGSGGHGQERMWRTFDYTHIIQLYWNMYLISKMNPELVHYLDADGYLERAYLTAKAFFEVPYQIFMRDGWVFNGYTDWAFKQGNFHEMKIPSLIRGLMKEGKAEWAEEIRNHWENKVKYMLYDHPYPFGSEMSFDSTAFESTHIIAKYGLENDVRPDERGFFDKNYYGPGKGEWLSHPNVEKRHFLVFMEKEIAANLAARGVIEPAYYLLGSDIRQAGNTNYNLSYMTQLGAWSIVDYALYYAKDPAAFLRVGYPAYLASWALVHTGDDYPWRAHPGNKGAAAWAFDSEKYGPQWIGKSFLSPRGPWRFDGEIDSGFAGAVRTAATIVVNDPIFGMLAYGGELRESDSEIAVIPKDGVRQRFHWLTADSRLHLILSQDGFTVIKAAHGLERIEFGLENRTGDAHPVTLSIDGLPDGEYGVTVNGERRDTFRVQGLLAEIILFVSSGDVSDICIARHITERAV